MQQTGKPSICGDKDDQSKEYRHNNACKTRLKECAHQFHFYYKTIHTSLFIVSMVYNNFHIQKLFIINLLKILLHLLLVSVGMSTCTTIYVMSRMRTYL